MNINFDEILNDVLEVEKIGYVNNPDDHGGPTNSGITINTLSDYLGRPATIDDIKNMNPEMRTDIYKKCFWDRLSLDKIVYKDLAWCLFDQGVNRGIRKVAEQIQKIVDVKVDGVIGPVTLQAINTKDPRKLLLNFIKVSQNSYTRIVEMDPTQAQFINGWIKRTHRFLDRIL